LKYSSDLQEEFATVHPEEHEPIAEQDRGAGEKVLEASAREAEEVRTQMDAESADEKFLKEMRDAVGGNRVHADDDERKRPFPETFHINDPTERR
jgi:hypothetical protein